MTDHNDFPLTPTSTQDRSQSLIQPLSQQSIDTFYRPSRLSQLSQSSQLSCHEIYSDFLYEGIVAQNWHSKGQDDDDWKKLNELRRELIDLGLLHDPPRCHLDSSQNKADETKKRYEIIRKIKILLDRFDQTKKPIGMLSRRDWANTVFDEIYGIRLNEDITKYTFISKSKRARMLTLLCRVYVSLSSNRYSTKRDLYYRDKTAYMNQRICDELIEDLCCITNNTRKELHILSCPKGLIYGKLEFTIGDVQFKCTDHAFGLTISHDIDLIENIQSDAKFILIVEKDASFQHLINQKIIEKFPIIMITGKGFPDCDTRRLLKLLVETLSIPVLGFVDANPWGLEILCIYRYGSLAMAHAAENCVIPQIRWLGLLPSDIKAFDIDVSMTESLNDLDLAKINSLRRRPYIRHNKLWAEQLDYMEESNIKAELQAIENCVETYLPEKIKKGGWI